MLRSNAIALTRRVPSATTSVTSHRHVTIATPAKTRPATTPSLPFTAPPLHSLKVYDEALKALQSEQTKLSTEISALESQNDPSLATKVLRKKVALGYTSLANHWQFNAGKVDFASLSLADESAETFEAMKQKRFNTFVVPKLVKLANTHGLYEDAFPGKTPELARPKVNVEVNFENTKWEACYGQPIPPNWALYSPKITINTHSPHPAKYTLALMDLDRPSLSTNSIQEWCHWLVTDIPVTNRLVIPAGSSPFLAPATSAAEGLTGASFHPNAPKEEPVIPGTVVLPYVPPHPANSNPRKTHRYLLTVFEQTSDAPLDVQVAKLRADAGAGVSVENRKAWEKDHVGEKEAAMQFVERGAFSTWGLKEKCGLKVAGYAFFTAGWNLHTPEIYSRLGIHEPVYGEFPRNPLDEMHKLAQATHTATTTRLGDKLSSLSLQEIQHLNSGEKASVARFKLPTRASIQAEEMRAGLLEKRVAAQAKEAAAVAAASKGKKGKGSSAKTVVRERKMPRLTTVGSVAVVRAKEAEVARAVVGEVTKSVFEKRGRYHNV
ncbi:MFT2-Corn MFT-like protein [Podochytrium sp. JEL0797]|nr:MFT2-Corn MFT-like protein [Podochytrium sp. JEL0797]